MKTTQEQKIATFILSVFEDNGLSYSRNCLSASGVEAIEDMKKIQNDLEDLKWRIVGRVERLGKSSGFLSQLMTIQEQLKFIDLAFNSFDEDLILHIYNQDHRIGFNHLTRQLDKVKEKLYPLGYDEAEQNEHYSEVYKLCEEIRELNSLIDTVLLKLEGSYKEHSDYV
tara:strand:- start:87 stop:593 length:507 start_codon:yes stop_codon:yes gene_type:complete